MLGSKSARTLEHDWRMLTRSAERAYLEGHLSKAEDICWEGLSKAKLIGEFEPRLAISLSNLAVIQRLRGQMDKAEDLSNIALRIFQAVDRRSPFMAQALLNSACFFHDEGRWGEARRLYGKAISLLEEGSREDLLCRGLLLFSRLCSDQGRDAQAETILKRVNSLEPDATEVLVQYYLTACLVALRQDRLSRGEQMLAEATETIEEEGLAMQPVWRSSVLALRGDIEVAQYKAARAVSGSGAADFQRRAQEVHAAYDESLALREQMFGPFHPSCGDIHRRRALFHFERDEYEASEQVLRRALTIALSCRGPYHFDTLRCLELSLEVLRLGRRHNEAAEMEERMATVERKVRERARETYVVWGEPDEQG